MARQIVPQSRFAGGISYGEKEGVRSSFLWAKGIDYRTDPGKIKINPKALKISGNVVEGLIMCGDQYDSTDSYFYDDVGNIYKRDSSSETWTKEHTASDSSGNGMKYFGEDLFLYYTTDTTLGRYGPFGGTKSFVDDFLGAEGGVPLNTASLVLNGTSQYATAADHASLSITGDLSIEIYAKLDALPAAASEITLVSKWDGSGDERSYKFGIKAVDAVFGDGSDSSKTISSNTTDEPTDSAATGTAATYSLSATNASFAVGDQILIHQTQGTGAGKWERNEIASYTAGTITTESVLSNTYTTGAQVLVLKQYTDVTVNSGKTWTAKAWNGTVGGILSFLANGTITNNGTITAAEKGFRGGAGTSGENQYAYQGEGTSGTGSRSSSANGNGGGGTYKAQYSQAASSGGGGHATSGGNGVTVGSSTRGLGGGTAGTADLTTMVFGGGSGGGAGVDTGTNGVAGGGIIFLFGADVVIASTVSVDGADGNTDTDPERCATGGGGAGSVLIKAQTATLGTNNISAAGGTGGTGYEGGRKGGDGGDGRIHLDYYTSYTGSTTPTLDVTQDDSLVTTTVYQLQLSVCSTDGTAGNVENLTKTLTSAPETGQWKRYAVKWDASESQADFFIGGASVGQATGSKTDIYDSTALLAIGANFDSGGSAENFLDGKVDDIRIYSDLRTDNEFSVFKDVELPGTDPKLAGYYQVDSSTDDDSTNSNSLTLVDSPSYDTDDVPFASPTSRNDLDQSLDTSGDTYALTTAISESSTHKQEFVPAKDPQKSIEVNIAAKGTGDWTLTLHDSLNREIATVTVANGDLPASGDYEFMFSSVWRPHIGATYHFHLTSTVADGTVVSTSSNDLNTADFHTYYQFLVSNKFHGIEHHLEKLNIANERYLATWDGITYNPHKLTLPSGYNIRAMGIWREYLVMGVARGSNIEDYDIGYLFFWDGISTTYNFYTPIYQGGVNAIASGDPLYFIAGYSANLMKYEGGKPKKIRKMPYVGTSIVEVNPEAMSMWKSLIRIGMAEDSTSTDIHRGVYSYGSLHREIPETLSFDYPLSLDLTQDANIEIGMLMGVGSELLVSWRNNGAYGVDSIQDTNNPQASATIEFLISDIGRIHAQKSGHVIRAYFKELASGDTVTLKYKRDRESGWHSGSADDQRGYAATAADKEARLNLPKRLNRFNEIQVGIDITTSNTTSPELYGWAIDVDNLQRERRT